MKKNPTGKSSKLPTTTSTTPIESPEKKPATGTKAPVAANKVPATTNKAPSTIVKAPTTAEKKSVVGGVTTTPKLNKTNSATGTPRSPVISGPAVIKKSGKGT